MTDPDLEQTLVLIKPDALKNSLTGYVLSQLSEFHTGLRFAAAKIVNVSRMLAEEHYAEHQGKAFFPALIDHIRGRAHYPNDPWKRRVIAFAFMGRDAIKKVRKIAGPTNPAEAREKQPGCIRALGMPTPILDASGKAIGQRMDNLIHASANAADAEREVKLWFRPGDIPPLMRAYATAVCQEHFYFKDGRLFKNYEPDSMCLLAPADVVWASDLDALQRLYRGESAACTLSAVAAKYLINDIRDNED